MGKGHLDEEMLHGHSFKGMVNEEPDTFRDTVICEGGRGRLMRIGDRMTQKLRLHIEI